MLKKIFIVPLVVLVSACGSETSATNPTDPTKAFSLPNLQSTAVGEVYSTNISGSISSPGANDINYTGFFSITNRSQVMRGGVLVTPREYLISLSDSSIYIAGTRTYYVDASNLIISQVEKLSGVVCTPSSPDNIPASIKIGDSGDLSPQVCDNNTTTQRRWRIEDAFNGNIFVTSEAINIGRFNSIISDKELSFTLNGNSEIIAVKGTTIAYGLTVDRITFQSK